MEKRRLGKTGIDVSVLGLGTVKFGRNEGVKYPQNFEIPSESFLYDLLQQAKQSGINLLDTAPAYGTSEERLGRLLKDERQDWIIAGKAGEEFENGKSVYHFTPDHFEKSLARSLERLKTDYLDILLIHSDGRDMEILGQDALIQKLYDFKAQGRVRAIGASTKTVEGGILAAEILDVVMASYHPGHTDEKAVLDYAAKNGKGVLLKKVFASGHKASPEESLRFGLAHPGVASAIIGTINPAHLKENVKAVLNLDDWIHAH